ncbi:hypothetical protein [Aliamphritea ceti]|uniref:hypothetical protein n=1 Tax=Aliamphritea ceti TaxID=1524258 RepID=UPI0021C3ED47|nr:hypothetical protein [Aliamphritea ceti]
MTTESSRSNKSSRRRKPGPLGKSLAVAGILLLTVMAYFSVRWMMADINSYPARNALINLQELDADAPIPVEKLERAQKAIDRAIEWRADHGDYYDIKAGLSYSQALHAQQEKRFRDYGKLMNQSLDLYRQASQLRPHWPYSWAGLALAKAKLSQMDEELNQAIDNSVLYGPWENTVNISISEAGLISWQYLPEAQQQAVLANIDRGLKRNFKEIRNIAAQLNQTVLLCEQLQESKEKAKLCKS